MTWQFRLNIHLMNKPKLNGLKMKDRGKIKWLQSNLVGLIWWEWPVERLGQKLSVYRNTLVLLGMSINIMEYEYKIQNKWHCDKVWFYYLYLELRLQTRRKWITSDCTKNVAALVLKIKQNHLFCSRLWEENIQVLTLGNLANKCLLHFFRIVTLEIKTKEKWQGI